MARLEGITRGGSVLTHLIFLLSRRSYGKVIAPAKAYALDPGLLFTVAFMEEGQEHAKQVKADGIPSEILVAEHLPEARKGTSL